MDSLFGPDNIWAACVEYYEICNNLCGSHEIWPASRVQRHLDILCWCQDIWAACVGAKTYGQLVVVPKPMICLKGPKTYGQMVCVLRHLGSLYEFHEIWPASSIPRHLGSLCWSQNI